MRNISCPNKNLPQWKELVEVVGENKAYYLWDQNNGVELDYAPNGQPSKLFSDLLSLYQGDRNAVIQAKAKVYSEAFKNWFGDWLSADKTNVSKVVDENGEPLIVYHHANDQFSEFSIEFDNYFSTSKGGTKKALFFTGTQNPASGTVLDRLYKMPVFLNAKVVIEKTGTKDQLREQGEGFVTTINRAAEEADAAIFHRIDDNQEIDQEIFVINNPNNVKSIDNQGTFSTEDNNIYRKLAIAGFYQDNSNTVLEISKFTSTKQLVDYLLASDDINLRTKSLLKKLNVHHAKLQFLPAVPENEVASYQNGTVTLYQDRIGTTTLQTTAEDLAHELLHHYLSKEYKTNTKFRQELDRLQQKYRKYWQGQYKPYGLGDQTSDEFLNEFMSNQSFRAQLKRRSRNLFEILKQAILTVVNKIIGRKTKSPEFDQDLQNLQKEVLGLIDDINDYGLDTGFNDNITHRKVDTNPINKTYDKIQKGLKSRLNAVKRYTTKNPNIWNRLTTVIQQLQNSEAEQGILQFIDHINDTIGDSVRFLSRPFDEINAKQIRQLSQDYVGFYKPLLDDINYLLDTTDLFKDLPNYDAIRQEVTVLSNQMNSVNNRFMNIARAKGIQEVVNFLQAQGMPQTDIDALVDYLNDPTTDTSLISNWFGMASNSDNAVIRSIAKILNDTMNRQQRDVLEVGNRLVELLDKAKEKYGTDVQKLLYEKLDDGTYSGYRVSKVKYGQYKKDCTEFIDSLAKKLGITKDKEGQYVLPEDGDIQKKWFDGISQFYSKRAVRRHKAEYYTLRNKMLSMKTRDAINEIQNSIDAITNPITIDGVEHVELLSDTDYRQLMLLRRQKQLLANSYNLDGTVKTGVDAQIAKELTDFHNEVNKRVKYIADWDRYNKDLAKIEKQYRNDPDKIEQWKQRNTKKRLTQKFYDLLDSLEKAPQTELYRELVEKRRQLRQMFTDPQSGKVDVASLSDSDRRALLDLDQAIANAYMPPESRSQDMRFEDIAEVVTTEEYTRDAQLARQNGTYNEWFNANHYENYKGQMHPASYYTQLKPKNEARYTETVPTGKYTTLDPSSEWYDNRFDPNGPSTQPSMEFYDNTKAYNDMASKPEVKALYDAIEEVMNQSNSYISFLTFANDNRMPQVPARFMQVMMRNSGLLNKIKYSFSEFIETQPDDYDYVDDFNTMPNGDPIKVIPTRFIKMLDDPNSISTDAVASVIAYYAMADNYRLMSQKQDVVELMLGLLRNLTISTKKGIKNPGDSNAYKQAQLLVDRLMYGRNKTPMKYEVFGKELNVGKALDITRNFITKVNLSGNLWSIATSFFTDATYTTLESRLGRFFDSKDLRFAISEFQKQLPSMMANIGNPNPKGKLPFLMRLNQVVKDNQETYDRLDQSKTLRAINQNFWFMGYTQSDYTVKSHTLLSVYHNYRFVKGKGFMSKQEYINQFYPTDHKKGANAFDQLEVTLYDAYQESDKGDVTVRKEYEQYITTKLLDDVKNRIEVLSRRIDGTMREVDKAQVHANSLASYLVMHRNFMISALHDRFKRRQYNLDLHMMEEGYYRSTGRFLSNVIKNRHFALTQLLADYNQLEEYEQYGVRRVAQELALIAASTTVAIAIASLVDGDDDYNNWLMQSITYIAMRSAFEFRTMYNPLEFLALIKSPTAAFTTFDNASSIINLLNPASYVGDRTPFTIIDRGSYEGMPVILRNIIKVTPFRSIFEAGDPEAKRNYLQNQLMNF